MDQLPDVILVFPDGTTNVGRRAKKVSNGQARAVKTLARMSKPDRDALLEMASSIGQEMDSYRGRRGSHLDPNRSSRWLGSPDE
jgi:hypothetical protein